MRTIAAMTADLFSWWRWPGGLAWRWALRAGEYLRRRRYETFLRVAAPRPGERVLDVGVSAESAGAENYLERWYSRPEDLTACGLGAEPAVCRDRGVRFVRADGRRLPFDDDAFDVVHCNAVIEHVGSRADQRRFVRELIRVGRRVWIATPDANGPVEPHTLLPFVHWFARPIHSAIYRACGRAYFADPTHLNPLRAEELLSLFPRELRASAVLRRQYLLGLPVVAAAYLDQRR